MKIKNPHSCTSSRWTPLALLLGGILVIPQAKAATVTWAGTGSTPSWNTNTNWSGNSLPGSTDTALFATPWVTQTVSLDASRTIDTLAFGATSTVFTIGSASDVTNGYTLTLKNVTEAANVTGTAYIAANIAQSSTGSVWNIAGSGPIQVQGVISGTGALMKTGAGTLMFTGANSHTYTGQTNVNQGTLVLDFTNMTTPTNMIASTGTLSMGGGSLQVKQKTGAATSQTFAKTNFTAGASAITATSLDSNGVTLALGTITRSSGAVASFTPPTYGGITTTTSNTNGILGTWATVGSGASLQYATVTSGTIGSYTGATAATAADLSNVTSATTNYSFGAGATQTAAVTANTLRYTGGAATLANGGYSTTLNSLMNAGTGALTINGAGSLTIGANKELVIHSSGQNITISSNIANNSGGASSITFNGAGSTLGLYGGSTATGDITVVAGTVDTSYSKFYNAANIYVGSANGGAQATFGSSTTDYNFNSAKTTNVYVYSNGLFNIHNPNSGYLNNLTIVGGTAMQSYAYINGTVTMTGGLLGQISGGGAIGSGFGSVTTLATSATAVISANVTYGYTTYNVADGSAAIDLLVSGIKSGNGSVTKNGSGVMAMSAANTWAGATAVNQGVLLLMNSLAIQNSPITVSSGTLAFDSSVASHAFQSGVLKGTGNITLEDNAVTPNAVAFTINTASTGTYSGVLSGAGSLIKTGIGNEVLGGTNTYTGVTTVSAGTLTVDGQLGNSAVTVSSTATLGGIGSINGTVVNNGTIAGSLTFNNDVSVNSGATASASAFNGNITNNGSINSAFNVQSGKTLSGTGSVNGAVVNSGAITGGLTFNNDVTVNGGATASASAFNGNIVANGTITSAVNVQSGKAISGTGSVTNSVTVLSGGKTSAGNGNNTGVLTLDLAYNSGAKAEFNVSSSSATSSPTAHNSGLAYSQVVVSGSSGVVNLQIGSGSTIQPDGSSNSGVALQLTLTASDYITLCNNASANYLGGGANDTLDNYFVFKLDSGLSTGEFQTLELNIDGVITSGTIYYSGASDRFNGVSHLGDVYVTVGGTTQEFAVSYMGNYSTNSTNGGNDIVLTAVPEPSTWAILVGGIGTLVLIRGGRRRHA